MTVFLENNQKCFKLSSLCSHGNPRREKESWEGRVGRRAGRTGAPHTLGRWRPTSFHYCPEASPSPSLWPSSLAPEPPPAAFSCRCAGPCVTRKRQKAHDTWTLHRCKDWLLPLGPYLYAPRGWGCSFRHPGTLTVPVYGQGSTAITWEASQVLQNTLGPWTSEVAPHPSEYIAYCRPLPLRPQTGVHG